MNYYKIELYRKYHLEKMQLFHQSRFYASQALYSLVNI